MSTSGKKDKNILSEAREIKPPRFVTSVPTVYVLHQAVLCIGRYWSSTCCRLTPLLPIKILVTARGKETWFISRLRRYTSISFLPNIQIRSRNYSLFYSVCPGGCSPGCVVGGEWIWPLSLNSAEVKNSWSVPPFHFSLCHVMCTEATICQIQENRNRQ